MTEDVFEKNEKPPEIDQELIRDLHLILGIDAVSAFGDFLEKEYPELVEDYKRELRLYYDIQMY